MAGITAIFAAKDRISPGLANISRNGRKTTSVFKSMAKTAAAAFSVKKVVDFGKSAVMAFADFESQMARVHSITGANTEQFAKLNKTAKELGKTTIFSAKEVAKGMEYAGMAGWKTTQIVDGMPAILDLAAASGEDLATVSDIVTNENWSAIWKQIA